MQQRRGNHRRQRYHKPNYESKVERNYGILPPPGILESYEEISPGAVSSILEMAHLEQEHRHKWENNYLKAMAYTVRVGILLEFTLAIIILFVCIMLAGDGKTYLASLVAICGFGFLAAVVFIASYTKKYILRPKRTDELERKF